MYNAEPEPQSFVSRGAERTHVASGGFGVPEQVALVGGGVGFVDGSGEKIHRIVDRDIFPLR